MAAQGLEPNHLPRATKQQVPRSLCISLLCTGAMSRYGASLVEAPSGACPMHQVPLTVLPSVPHKEDSARDSQVAVKGTLPMHLAIGPLSLVYAT